MNCELVKEKLVDYIEENLSKEEMLKIQSHISKCSECMKEVEELKDTIEIIEEKGKRISIPAYFEDRVMEKMLKQNKPIKKKRRMRTGLIAVILSLVFVVTAFATNGFDIFKWWQNSSIKQLQVMNKLIDSGVGERLNIEAEDKDIKITVEGVVADELSTMLLLKVEDKKDDIMYGPTVEDMIYGSTFREGINIIGNFNIKEGVPVLYGFRNLYLKKDDDQRIILQIAPIIDNDTIIKLNINKLKTVDKKDEKSFKYIEGNWDFNIPVKKCTSSKTYYVDKEMDIEGNKILIEYIQIYSTSTQLTYSFKDHRKNENYEINNLQLVLKYNGKTIDRNILGGMKRTFISDDLKRETISLDTLFLDNPDKVEVVVKRYNKTTWAQKKYDIQLDNLLQTIDYMGNKITIEEVNIGENITELIVSEEESRSYGNLIMNVKVENSHDTYIDSENLEYYYTDSVGKRIFPDDEDFLTKDPVCYITKRKIIVKNGEDLEEIAEEQGHSKKIVPVQFCIDGREEIVKPNTSMTIQLAD